MEMVSNENNLSPLKDCIAEYAGHDSNKGGEILIASGWIQSEYFKRLFPDDVVAGLASRNISIRVLLRVGSPTDLKISDIALFRFIEVLKSRGVTSSFRFSSHHHAKLYVVGKTYAMIGSFNLTSGGFGDDTHEGRNPEAGITTTAKTEVKAAIERFDVMWDKASTLADSLAGFVANESEDSGFWAIGVRELPAGMFVQTAVGDRIILGKVERSLRYRSDFFGADRESILSNPFIFEQFGIEKPKRKDGAINRLKSHGSRRYGASNACQTGPSTMKPVLCPHRSVVKYTQPILSSSRQCLTLPLAPSPTLPSVTTATSQYPSTPNPCLPCTALSWAQPVQASRTS